MCVPFMVTNYGYGLVWDNPSKTRIEPGMAERTRWISEAGNRVSYFVVAGRTTDEIYGGYRRLTGETPLLPKAAYGYIQCKAPVGMQMFFLGVFTAGWSSILGALNIIATILRLRAKGMTA